MDVTEATVDRASYSADSKDGVEAVLAPSSR